MKKIIIINGPNLNLLGKREPETYGNKTFDSYLKELVAEFPNMELNSFQSNVEGEIINKIQETGFSFRWNSAKCWRIHPYFYSYCRRSSICRNTCYRSSY